MSEVRTETLIIRGKKDGKITIEQKGFVGNSCDQVNKHFATLGTITERLDTSIADGRQKLPNQIKSC